MRQIDRPRPHTTTPVQPGRRSPHAGVRPGRRAGDRRLISDAVIAGYILDISERHRAAVSAPDRRERQ